MTDISIPKPNPDPAQLSPMRILIIDDEDSIRHTLAALLQALGHEVIGVGDGASALKELDKARFDLAFLDLRLGEENGLDLLPDLLRSTSQLDVVVFTAYASIESAVEAMGDEKLRVIAGELVEQLQSNVTVDWHKRESARARMRVLVKRILKRYGYPPDLADDAVQTVLAQAELLLAN